MNAKSSTYLQVIFGRFIVLHNAHCTHCLVPQVIPFRTQVPGTDYTKTCYSLAVIAVKYEHIMCM